MSSLSAVGGASSIVPMYTGSVRGLNSLAYKVAEPSIHSNIDPNLITQRNADGDSLTISFKNAMAAAGNAPGQRATTKS